MKNLNKIPLFLLVTAVGFSLATLASGWTTGPETDKKVRLKMETKTLRNGTYSKVLSDVYYRYGEGRMLMHYTYPMEFFFLSNDKGEAKIYDPKAHTVTLKQGLHYSSENSYLYYFLANNANDLGFKDEGYQLRDTRFEDGLMITTWAPPAGMSSQLKEVEMVHENYLPIYLGFTDPKGDLVKRVYYYEYKEYNKIKIPLKITQIDKFSEVDSAMTKTTLSEVTVGNAANHEYFNFEIPSDAAIVK